MSDQPANTGTEGGGHLFQGMDEQERIYAPEEVPGADLPDIEVDQGGTVGGGTAGASDAGETNTLVDRRGAPAPAMPVAPAPQFQTPIAVPSVPEDRRVNEDDTAATGDQE